LLAAEAAGHQAPALALEVYCYKIVKYIGAYAAALGGLDGLLFGGGVGENSAEIRSRVCESLAWLGVKLEEGANSRPEDHGGLISPEGAAVSCFVEPVDEALLIALDTVSCLNAGEGRKRGGDGPETRPH
jgi:acetate kinase